MLTRPRILLASATVVLTLAAAIGTASANRLSVNETGWRHVWTPLRFIAGTNTVGCNLTVEGSFHNATSRKVAGALSGFVTRLAISSCTGGSATVLTATLPWHVSYQSFTGTLPRITGVTDDLIGAGFQIQPTGSLACLARMTEASPGRSITNLNSEGRATSITADVAAEIPLEGSGGLCRFAGEGHFEGTGAITKLGSTELLVVRLI